MTSLPKRAVAGASAAVLCLLTLCPGCGGDPEPVTSGTSGATAGEASGSSSSTSFNDREVARLEALLGEYDVEIPLVTYDWNPADGDAAVSAADGGPGFTGEGWTTNLSFPALGSADAVRGGQMSLEIPDWPATMRQAGQNWNTSFNYRARDICVEFLLMVHPATLEWIPKLATHWQIIEGEDEGPSTYRYRINPRARFNDGSELTAYDVVASWHLLMDEGLNFPSNILVYGKLEPPVALSKYIVEVKEKKRSWRNFLYFSGSMPIFPAKDIDMPGAEYLAKYNNKFHPLSGPYEVREENIDMNKSITITRRDDWWDEGNPAWQGLWNFDSYKCIVIQDRLLAFEKAKKGEIDYYIIPKAQWWAEELPEVENIQRGVLQRRKFYNDAPVGTSGLAFNMTRPHLDDLRIRKAFAHLQDRDTYIEKLFFNEYAKLTSYWQGPEYSNPNNVPVEYDPLTAVELLEDAGWTEIGPDGIRVKDGQRLEFEVAYRSELSEPYLTTYQEDCKEAGIHLELRRFDNTTYWKNAQGREYDIANQAWGALVFPNPETSWSGALAKTIDNNNITAFSDARVDELLDVYDIEYDETKRADIIKEIDGIVYAAHPYALGWYSPAQRVVYKNKFAQPEWGVWRVFDREEMMYCWWVDPELEAKLLRAEQDPSIVLETQSIEHRFWEAWNYAQSKKKAEAVSLPTEG